MFKTYVSLVAAGALISAALMVGLLSLTATAAGACTGSPACGGGPPPAAAPARACTEPDCIKGVPPAAAAAMECSDPSCLSGTRPAIASWPGSRLTGRTGHGTTPARTADGVSTAASEASAQAGTSIAIAVNCPPPSGVSVRDPGSGGC